MRKPAPKRVEKFDPFKAYIVDRVNAEAPDRIPAVFLFSEINPRGYDGGETRVKQFVRGLALARAPALRFEPSPVTKFGQPWDVAPTSLRCSSRRWAGSTSSSATTSASRR